MRFPKSWNLFSGTDADTVQTEFGTYAWQIRLEDPGLLTYNRYFEITQNTIPAEKYTEFVNYLTEIASGDQHLVLFREE